MTARGWARELRGPAILLVVYGAVRFAFARFTEDDGLFTPSGAPRLGIAVLGLAMLALRIVVLFVLPALMAWRAVRGPAGKSG